MRRIVLTVCLKLRSMIFRVPLPLDRTVVIVDEWLQQPSVELVAPTPRHWTTLREMLVEGQAGAAMASDTHLAALAREHGATAYTTDRDFMALRR